MNVKCVECCYALTKVIAVYFARMAMFHAHQFNNTTVALGTARMNLMVPKRIATVGGILISISGIVNTILGVRIGAVFYYPYPGGRMGHVGIIAGIVAIAIGFIIVFVIVRIYEQRNRWSIFLGGILTIVVGHVGVIAGAIYIGTVGVLLCYIAGIWLIFAAARGVKSVKS